MSDWMDAQSHADRALEMYERGRWAEAEAELRKAILLNPDQAEWHFNLGLTLEASGRDTDALACYERTFELMPDQAEPLLAAGVVANRLAQYPRAIDLLDRALTIEPKLESAYAHKIDCQIRLALHEEAETTFYLAQNALEDPSAQCFAVMAESLILRKQFDRAEWCLKEALRLEPSMPRLRARLACVSHATGKSERAVQLYLRELRDDPGDIQTILEYGQLLLDLERLPEAAEKFRRVLEIEPANLIAHFELGRIAMVGRRYEQAHLEFELVLKLDSGYPAVRMMIGQVLLLRGRPQEARTYLLEECQRVRARLDDPGIKEGPAAPPTSAAPVDNNDVSGQRPDLSDDDLPQLAALLLEADEPGPAAQILEAAVKLNPTADLLRQLALAHFRAGDLTGGRLASRRVLKLDPACVRSMHNLALAALQIDRLRIASGWIKRGLRVDHHDDGLRRLRMRVWIALLKKRAQRALERGILITRYWVWALSRATR
ncbi:MAG: tetratricopeptide repeat protein [Phycisphaerales bacterium]|nr:tetratricopeptide repeat protein [Phycisphaerales bacterium]MCI0630269.1 tetratricopeptide repeat protein [Phycisphaerales bacterium]MCI0676703.1 tetratricopeptide repeat protein [Phycisphaerales bacterium]